MTEPKRESGCGACRKGIPAIWGGQHTCSTQDPKEKGCEHEEDVYGNCYKCGEVLVNGEPIDLPDPEPHQSHQESGWEAEFDRKFPPIEEKRDGSIVSVHIADNPYELKVFISQLLSAVRKEERRILGEKLLELRGAPFKKKPRTQYQEALDDALQALDQ